MLLPQIMFLFFLIIQLKCLEVAWLQKNRSTLQKFLRTLKTEKKMLFGQGQRTDKAEHVGQPVDSGHSRAVGGGTVSHSEVTSHSMIAPGAAEGSVDIVEDSHVVTPAPA